MPYKNKENLLRNQQKYRQLKADKFFEYMSDKECIDCGMSDIRYLDHDHVRGIKKFGVSRMVRSSTHSWEAVKKEIEKCDIRCANCHRIKTAIDFNYRHTK